MKFEKGTPAFGLVLGLILAGAGALVMAIGFWRTLVLVLLFGLGYFLGAVNEKGNFVKNMANRAIPERDNKPIDLRETLKKEQEISMPGTRMDEDSDKE